MAINGNSNSLPASPLPIPPDLKSSLFDPETPWHLDPSLFQKLQNQPPIVGESFKKCDLPSNDPLSQFVVKYFFHHKPPNLGIKRIFCIHNPAQTQAFEAYLKTLEAEEFPHNWQNESERSLRERTIQRWQSLTNGFTPLKVPEADRSRQLFKAKVLPLWHGTSSKKAVSIGNSGFTYFGKHHFFNPNAPKGALASTDMGYFGSGIYFTNSAQYAAMYSAGHLFLSWVSMTEPYPVVSDSPGRKCSDMRMLEGHGAYQTYNAHYIPVTSLHPNIPYSMEYYPCGQGQIPAWDELVVFQKAQTLPRFWIETWPEFLQNPSLPSAEENYQQALKYELGTAQVAPNWKQAFPLYASAAKSGHVQAQVQLAKCHLFGIGTRIDNAKAAEILLPLEQANQGLSLLGLCYREGYLAQGKKVIDKVRAFNLFKKDNDLTKNLLAKVCLGECYGEGEGTTKDEKQAEYFYKEAFPLFNQNALAGDSFAQTCLALCYLNGWGAAKNKDEALKWYKLAADQGLAVAQNNLGSCYQKGVGVDKNKAEAIKWYKLAADQGLAFAQWNLGYCYRNGFGVGRNEAKAFKWYKLAADQGLADAQCKLGYCYENSIGIGRNETEAVKWYKLAADQGLAVAQCNLGYCYENGLGIAKNKDEAIKWYKLTAVQGSAFAQSRLKDLLRKSYISRVSAQLFGIKP